MPTSTDSSSPFVVACTLTIDAAIFRRECGSLHVNRVSLKCDRRHFRARLFGPSWKQSEASLKQRGARKQIPNCTGDSCRGPPREI
jgi:hypothetical protein